MIKLQRTPSGKGFSLPAGREALLLVLLGLGSGFLSGMFGVGGGIVIVPGLIAILGFNPKLASGTSLAAIIPLASVGVISYAVVGSVSWVGAGLLAAGGLIGTQLGSFLLKWVSSRKLQAGFAWVMIASAVMLFVTVPSRDAVIEITWTVGAALVIIGFCAGLLAGLLGVGGGMIVVPALMLILGASDLVARGTSLLMMIPAAIGGTVPNYLRGNVDLGAALIISMAASTTTVLGSRVAHLVSPAIANICFAVLIVVVAFRMIYTARKAEA